MHPGTELQFGGAARCTPPLVSLLLEPAQHHVYQLSRLAHPVSITALAVWRELVVSGDSEGRLRLWRLRLLPAPAVLRQLASQLLHAGAINCLELHHPSGVLATAGGDGAIRLWQLPQLAARGCLAGHGGSVTAVAFSSCGAFLASTSFDGTLRLWEVGRAGALEQLAVLQLQASSVAFAPGDDGALLLAASGSGPGAGQEGPLLLDLRQVPACRWYCTQLLARQQLQQQEAGGSSSRGGAKLPSAAAGAAQAAAPALHPAAAIWLPGSPGQRAAAGLPSAPAAAGAMLPHTVTPAPQGGQLLAPAAAAAVVRPAGQAVDPDPAAGAGAAPAATPASGICPGLTSPARQAGSVVMFSRKRRQRGQEETPGVGSGGGSSVARSARSWLSGGDSALRPPAAAPGWRGGRLFGAWSAPLSPTSPPATATTAAAAGEGGSDFGDVPAAAVAARYDAPPCSGQGGGGGEWDAEQRCFVYRQGGHSLPVCWLLPLPAGLHVLTVAADGEAKLWPASSSSSSSAAGSSASPVCCTLLPAAGDRQVSPLSCRPAVSACGQYVVGGAPSGTLSCWDLRQLQRQAHLPLSQRSGNAAAASSGAHKRSAVTAVALGAADTLLASGDASGRLVLRWR